MEGTARQVERYGWVVWTDLGHLRTFEDAREAEAKLDAWGAEAEGHSPDVYLGALGTYGITRTEVWSPPEGGWRVRSLAVVASEPDAYAGGLAEARERAAGVAQELRWLVGGWPSPRGGQAIVMATALPEGRWPHVGTQGDKPAGLREAMGYEDDGASWRFVQGTSRGRPACVVPVKVPGPYDDGELMCYLREGAWRPMVQEEDGRTLDWDMVQGLMEPGALAKAEEGGPHSPARTWTRYREAGGPVRGIDQRCAV